MEKDRGKRLENQERLRELRSRHARDAAVVCSHDPIEYERISGQPMAVPEAPPAAHAPT